MKDTISYNFGGLPKEYSGRKDSLIAILPVPFDKTSSWIRGAAKGPHSIITASGHMELYDIETGSEVYKKGIHTLEGVTSADSRGMIERVYKEVSGLLGEGKFVVLLGGEHMVSLGSLKAHAESFDDLSILHLDAHSDRRESYEGNRYSHACVMARAGEISDNIVSVGIRSMDSTELGSIEQGNVFYAPDIRNSGDWIREVTRRLSKNVYVTIDLDVFDPSIMPSTGTPEPGGLGWYDVIDLLEHVSEERNIAGFDVVELCPSDNAAPDFLAAKLIYKLLSLKFARVCG